MRYNLSITARTPRFKRDDVADRLIVMRVKRIEAGRFKPERDLLNEVLDNRDALMTEIVHAIQEVVRSLKAGRGESLGVGLRMADFANFCQTVANYYGIGEQAERVLSKLSREQSEFTLEDDPMVELLSRWAQQPQNRAVTNAELCQELAQLAEKDGTQFFYKGGAASFAQRMRNLRPNLETRFDITERQAGGRKKLFTFKLKETGNE